MMSAQWRRRIFWGIVVLLVAGALLYGYWPRAQPVEVARARRGHMQVTVEEEGRTRVIDRFVVSAPIDGYARRSAFDVGDPVRQGDVLAELEPTRSAVLDPRSRAEAQARVAAADAALHAAEQRADSAKTAAELARTEYNRARDLVGRKLAPQEQLDQATARLRSTKAEQRSAEFGVEVAQFQLEAAKTALRYSGAEATRPAEIVRIRAPVDGNILKIYQKSEGAVTSGAPLVEVGNPRSLEVVVDVLSADAVRIEPGMRVIFKRWGGHPPLEGRVRTVEPVAFTEVSALGVEEQRVNVIADFVSDPKLWARLGDGYRVDAAFVIWEQDNVLQIPASALFRHGDGWAVYTVNDGIAHLSEVRIGHRSGLTAQVTGGLKEGATVITHPGDNVGDGSRVEPL
jgi:HlyD family secretion protein